MAGDTDSDIDSQLRPVLACFPATRSGIKTALKPSHAAISQVWILDDRWILRSRDADDTTFAEFHREQAVLSQLTHTTDLQLPNLEHTDDGHLYLRQPTALWTLHPKLPGHIIRPWQELHHAPEQEHRRLVRSLRHLHDATRGNLSPPHWDWLPQDTTVRLAAVRDQISTTAHRRVTRAIAQLRETYAHLSVKDACFVHGDYHWGNLLTDDQDQITGLLDLDWCRVAHPLEDLAYTAMMLIRDYDADTPRMSQLDKILTWYGVLDTDRPLFHECLILYTLFDVHLFTEADGLQDRDGFLSYQRDLLERLCSAG